METKSLYKLVSNSKCCVNGCTRKYEQNPNAPLRYYSFPSTRFEWRNERRQKWIEAIIKHNKLHEDWQPKRHTVICSAHFVGGEKSEHPLHPAYHPTIFPKQGSTKKKRLDTLRILKKQKSNAINAINTTTTTIPTTEIKNECPGLIEVYVQALPEEPCEVEDFQCQVNLLDIESLNEFDFDYMSCNLKVENNLNCAEVQVNFKNINNEEEKSTGNETICDRSRITESEAAHRAIATSNPWLQTIEFRGISSIRYNSELTDLCGVTFDIFNTLLKDLPEMNVALSQANRLLIFLMKLRKGFSDIALSILFNLNRATIRRIFLETLDALSFTLRDKLYWPDRESIKDNLPELFKSTYPNCRAFVDCIEIQLEIPEKEQDRENFYSNYKDCNSFKFFAAWAPNGFISYKSKCYGGGKADSFIATDCELIKLVKSGDVILSNKEFSSFNIALNNKNAILINPPYIENPEHISLETHIMKCIHQFKFFKILSSLQQELFPYVDSIVEICCLLINLQVPMKQSPLN